MCRTSARWSSPSSLIFSEAQAACSRDSVTPMRVHAVLAGGVPDHPAPAAAEVEQPLAGLEVELAGDQVVLRVLRLLEGRGPRSGTARRCRSSTGRGPSRRTRWRRRSGGGSPPRRGPASAAARPRRGGSGTAPPRAAARPGGGGRGRGSGAAVSASAGEGRLKLRLLCTSLSSVVGVAGVHAVQLEVAGDVGPGEAEVARRGEQVGQAALGGQVEPYGESSGPDGAAVVGREPQRQRLLEQPRRALRRWSAWCSSESSLLAYHLVVEAEQPVLWVVGLLHRGEVRPVVEPVEGLPVVESLGVERFMPAELLRPWPRSRGCAGRRERRGRRGRCPRSRR